MQVSDKERKLLLTNNRKELIHLVASRIVHPETNRLFPINIIEEAILQMGFDVKMNDSAKKQANYLIKMLAQRYHIKKADMEMKLTIREEWLTQGDSAAELDIQQTEEDNETGSVEEDNPQAQEDQTDDKTTQDSKYLEERHQAFLLYLKDNTISIQTIKEGPIISYVCIVEAAKFKDISIEVKKIYPKSISEITEYRIINKTVG